MTTNTLAAVQAPLLVIFAGLFLAIFLLSRRQKAAYAGLPPGPGPHWLTGNIIPQQYSWRHFADLTKQYGGVFTIWHGRTPLVVVGTVEAAEELLERQAAYTGDRPRQVVADEVHRCLLGAKAGDDPERRSSLKALALCSSATTTDGDACARQYTYTLSLPSLATTSRCKNVLRRTSSATSCASPMNISMRPKSMQPAWS